jgi:hypothetical protein
MNISILILIGVVCSYYIPYGHHNTTLDNFSFGSCFKGSRGYRQDIFNTINRNDPQIWLWLGDAAYVDNMRYSLLSYYSSTHPFEEDRMKYFNETKYNECKSVY